MTPVTLLMVAVAALALSLATRYAVSWPSVLAGVAGGLILAASSAPWGVVLGAALGAVATGTVFRRRDAKGVA